MSKIPIAATSNFARP